MPVWDGHGGSNNAGPPQRGLRPRGQSALDVIVEGGFLPQGSGPVEFAAWLRQPVDAIVADVNTYVDARFNVLWAPFVADMEAIGTAAQGHANAADADRIAAEAAQAAAEAAQAAAEAAAASVVGGSLAQGAIFGLRVSNNSVNPTTRIDVAIGQARSSNNQEDIILSTPMTKRLDAVWAAGTGNGGRDVATALALGQSWHVFVIWHPTGPTVDVLFSLSPTAPTLPAGYTRFRRIASLPRLGYDVNPASGTNIPAFTQKGNRFTLAKRNAEFVGQTGNASPMLKDFAGPLGVELELQVYIQVNYSGSTVFMRLTDPTLGVPPAFGGYDQWGWLRLSSNELYLTLVVQEPCNTSCQLYVHISNASATWAAGLRGWVDMRGQL
jgi:hypothetical protein